tara:strand:- start:1457 stop:2227 length:771 start_codon:yes stop_codon:yes gene_type:complete
MKFIILGCGSSMGVPRSDGFFGKCDPKNKKNYRSRCSALLKTKNENILFDTSPDLRNQLLKNNIKNVNRVFYSHMHADQTHGINDLRIFFLKNKKTIPVYADNKTKKYLVKTFGYCFYSKNSEYPATLKFQRLKKSFLIGKSKEKINIRSFPVKHGSINSTCYIINEKLAYISDVNNFFPKNEKYLYDLKYLIIDCLRYEYHPSHFNLEEVLKLIKKLKPKKAILTNLHSDLDYKILKNKLPKNIAPAYDGLTLTL